MHRREFLRYLILSSAATIGACKRSSKRSRQLANDDRSLYADRDIHTLLDTLLDAYQAKGFNVKTGSSSPYSKEQLQRQIDWFPGEIVPPLQALYTWHGGHLENSIENNSEFWFRDNAFLNLETAEREYKILRENFVGGFFGDPWLKYAFPFAAFEGSWYVLPTREHPYSSELNYPVICVFEGIDVFFYSLQSMLLTCIDWVTHPEFRKDTTLPRDIELSIWRKYNPGIFE